MPSTTIEANPQVMMPAYNPIKWIIDNTNKNDPGFRYIFTVYPAGVATPIAQYKVLPGYGTGYGEQDISKLMQSKVGFDIGAFGQNSAQAVNSWYQYDIDFGYEVIDNITYTSSLIASGGGDVEITFTAHGFIAGDQIIITQADGGVANPAVEGLHTVIFASGNLFVINVLFSTVTDATINGVVTYADLRRVIVLNDLTESDYEVFNGAYNFNINVNDNLPFPLNDYYGVVGDSKILTSLFGGAASTFLDAYFYLNLRVYIETYTVIYFDMNNNQLDSYSVNVAADGIHSFSVGPTALVTEDYYIVINDSTNFYTEQYFFTYDNRCAINSDQLIYLDRMGSWQSFAFQLKTYEKGQITREQYNQHIDGQIVSAEWVGVPLQTGFRTYNTNVTKTFDLNTNWMSEFDGVRFQELLTSPQVYYYASNYYAACVVDASTFEVFRQRNKNLIKQSVTIRLAQQDPING